MELECQRCSKHWEYVGKKKPKTYPQYVACPRCKTSVMFPRKDQVKGGGDNGARNKQVASMASRS